MITLMTGLPGDGKTLYTLCYVESMKGQRAVYYHGINQLTLPWTKIDDPKDWHKVPAGSIVVIDEAQDTFPTRGNGTTAPEHVAMLAKHRHEGTDLVLITQHPMMVDPYVRRLSGRHFHTVRTMGFESSVVHEWGSVKTNCDTTRIGSVKHVFKYPKASYGWYKSSEVHTHKRRIPARVFFFIFAPLLIIGLFYYGITYQQRKHEALQSPAAKAAAGTPATLPPGQTPSPLPPSEKPRYQRISEYISDREPFLQGFPHTAPIYQDVTKPKIAPVPSACISSPKFGCKCYTQQATVIADMPQAVCQQIVATGYFVDWDESGSAQPAAGAGRAVGPTATAPVAYTPHR